MKTLHKRNPFAVNGEMAELISNMDWSTTPLGPTEQWPQSLRTIVRLLLTSRFPMWMGWGPDLAFLYNDAYRAMTLGSKHPWALGRPSREVWAEVWDDVKPRIDQVIETGQATWDEQLLLFLERSGYREETYHTFSYSAITDDEGAVCGLFCVVSEETERVLSERRMALLRATAIAMGAAMTESELFAALEIALAESRDLPFTLTYLFEGDSTLGRLVSSSGILPGHEAAPLSLSRDDAEPPYWLDGNGDANTIALTGFNALPPGPWDLPPADALVLPIFQHGQKGVAGLFVAALNPFRPVDEQRIFVSLLVGQIAAGVANVHAYEEERRRAQALAELDRAKTTFFSNVSHEFRTPLTLMLGPIEDLLTRGDADVSADARMQLELTRRNGQRLLKLVNMLLDFSRIEVGRVRASFEPVNLSELTADIASTFRSAMDKAGLDYRVECEAFTDPVYVDCEMWEKILLNLISNAFKFTLTGQVVVSVVRKDSSVQVSVTDTGIGISGEDLPRVFDRFHRVEGSQGRSPEGSGIGLALVQELVKLHGGTLSASSELGRGSLFTVTLPLGVAHLPADYLAAGGAAATTRVAASYVEEALRWLPGNAVTAGSDPGAPDGRAGTVGRILLADDNADMRNYAHRLLGDRWVVESVSNGRDALVAARARRPDVIVTDVMMPELDGFGLLRELRADANLRHTPVIMLSARAGEEARLEGLAASADDYLVKPFSSRDLLARVEAQMIRSHVRGLEQQHTTRLNRIFRQAPVAVALLSGPNHVYELTNPAYQALIGDRNVLGRSIRDALPELAGQSIFEILDGVRQSGEPFVGRSLRVVLNRGVDDKPEDCYFDFVYQPLHGDDGSVDTIVVVAHDVTELASAKAEAETANRLKDEFLATLSHELRTPLNAVLGYTQMVRSGVIESQRLPAVLETIERNARLQEQLICDVLDVSRIITGNMRLDIRPVDLIRVINDALETVAPTAAAKGVRLQSAIDQPGVPVAGDARRLRQVVWNLLSNAIKFTPRGGRVQIRLERVNSHVELTVSDTGEGIAPEFLPHLFQRFRQADSTFTRGHGGLGLGLAICRHLVEAHGGRIHAASPGKGHGTTVRAELPLMIGHDGRPDALDRMHPALELPTTSELELADLSGRRVLLVDDDVDGLEMAKDALAAAGAHVVTAPSARDALHALDRATFDVAVLDIGLPEMDGYELLAAIRARPAEHQGAIPVIALTAYARAMDRTRSLQAGFQMHLSKPVQPGELATAVQVLAGHPS